MPFFKSLNVHVSTNESLAGLRPLSFLFVEKEIDESVEAETVIFGWFPRAQ